MKMKMKPIAINKATIFDIVRATLIGIIASLVLTLILALIVKLTGIGNNIILPLCQVIKIGAILLGCMLGIKEKSKGAVKGAIIGVLYTLFSVFVFLILQKSLDANSFSYIDFLAGGIAGAVSGIITVNFRKK